MKRRQFAQFALGLLVGSALVVRSEPVEARNRSERRDHRERYRKDWMDARHERHERHKRKERWERKKDRRERRERHRDSWRRPERRDDCSACW